MSKVDRTLMILLPTLLLIKVSWVLLTVTHYIVKKNNYSYELVIGRTEEVIHIFYNILMGVLLIYLYNNILRPDTVCINNETKKFLYVFGILMIIGNFQKSLHMYLI